MITITNGKLTIPEHERFIGFAGDNLVRKIEFLIAGSKEVDCIYRIFLTFDDGSVNYFVLPSRVTDEGVVLTWDIKREHIYKSGIVTAQIKSYSPRGVMSYTTKDTFIVGNSAEFSDYFKENGTEFTQYEKKLNELIELYREASVLMPYIGDNGNWYYYDSVVGGYVDSGKPSALKADSTQIADGSVTAEKLSAGAVNREDVFSEEMRRKFLSLPVIRRPITGDITDEVYNGCVTPGVYQIDTYTGKHQVLLVLAPDSNSYLMQMLFTYDKVMYRGIYCTEGGVYAEDDWTPWTSITDKGMKKAEDFFAVSTLGVNADPYVLSYQDSDPTTEKHIRIPISVLKKNILTLSDEGEYFVAETVEGALQELGGELKGVAELLAAI